MGKAPKRRGAKQPKSKFCECVRCANWKERCQHTTLAGRTDDPDALAFDKAVELFREGLALARDDKLEEAVVTIAKAYLLDFQCMRMAPHLPPQDNQEAAKYILDSERIAKMLVAGYGAPVDSDLFVATCIIKIAICDGTDGAEEISANLLQSLKENPELEMTLLGGHLKRSKLHYLRYRIYHSSREHEKTLKELEDGLAEDPSDALLMFDRVLTLSAHDFVSNTTLHKEWRLVAEKCHPDSFVLPIVYGRLAMLTFDCYQLGTYEEGCVYMEKTNTAYRRYHELNGNERPDMALITDDMVKKALKSCDGWVTQADMRKQLDLLMISSPTLAKILTIGCHACGKMQSIGGDVLFKCSKCKAAWYCCKECQKNDWNEHKMVCDDGGGPYQDLVDSKERDEALQKYITPEGYLVARNKKD